MIQDIFPHKLYNSYDAAAEPTPDSYVLSFHQAQVLLKQDDSLPQVSDMGQSDYRFLFRIDDHSYFLPNEHFPETENFTYHSVRAVRGNESIPKHQRYAILTGKHLSDWYRDTRFCGCCGSPLRHAETQRAMVCDNCQRHFYPRIMPAVIVGVIRDEQLLLTRYRTGFAYNALIAGFTEIGETLEETAAREVLEETRLQIKNIRYYKSQPWGIANDILAGFFCEVDGDSTIRMDTDELKYAEWVKRKEIALQPDDASLTNEMMQQFRDGKITKQMLREEFDV